MKFRRFFARDACEAERESVDSTYPAGAVPSAPPADVQSPPPEAIMTFPLRRLLPLLILTVSLLSVARADEAEDQKNAEAARLRRLSLLGAPAPDIHAEYVVNGGSKVNTLAGLREKGAGKVVLLIFGHLSRGTTTDALGDAQAWYAKYKLDGLAVILVPIYDPARQPQRWSRFDPSNGKAFKAKSATREQEEATFKEFASALALKFPIWKVTPEEAQKVFPAYGVDQAPEFVVIDPRGKIQLIQTGKDKADTVKEMVDKLMQAR
jgi:hypothetical protein